MKSWIAFWNILAKDMRTYYLNPLPLRHGARRLLFLTRHADCGSSAIQCNASRRGRMQRTNRRKQFVLLA